MAENEEPRDEDEDEDETLAGKIRGMGVGTEDPNIIGDAGPFDVPPGSDPPAGASER